MPILNDMASLGLDVATAAGERSEPAVRRAAPWPRSAHGRATIWLTLAFWLSNFVLLTLGTALSGNPHLAGITAMRALAMLFGLALCYVIHHVLTRPWLSTWRRRIVALALMAPVCAESFAWVIFFAEMAVDPNLSLNDVSWTGAVRTITFWTWFFLAWAGLYLALSYSFDVQAEQERTAELQARAYVAQLRALHSQINPHFLFNSLNSLSALILDREVEKAEAMVSKLSSFLRTGLAIDPSACIPLASEIALQRAYLEIEQLRYPDLSVEIVVPHELEDMLVPSLILQPVIENAVKYGVAGSPPPSRIVISVHVESADLVILVTDSGRGDASSGPGAGIGLRNVAERLRLMHGERASLDRGPLPGGGYQVRLTMPMERV